MRVLVTGGAGFIGSAMICYLIHNTHHTILNIDKLTYAGDLSTLNPVSSSDRYSFLQIDICDNVALAQVFSSFQPDAVMHFAAESHVDRSITGAAAFIQTNIIGTYQLLEVARHYWKNLPAKADFRFHHISTDEVYGDLGTTNKLFTESTCYAPSSPYSASKSSADHLVRAWHRTYGLPILITNCSNNYGSYQYPEKLIPLTILNALQGKPLPIYGTGEQVRDWLYVDDHVKALYLVLTKAKVGETYNIGGYSEQKNIKVVELICQYLEELAPNKPQGIKQYRELIQHVEDRAGHDIRYAIDATKINDELGWFPQESFATGLKKTVQWYLDNLDWCEQVSKKI